MQTERRCTHRELLARVRSAYPSRAPHSRLARLVCLSPPPRTEHIQQVRCTEYDSVGPFAAPCSPTNFRGTRISSGKTSFWHTVSWRANEEATSLFVPTRVETETLLKCGKGGQKKRKEERGKRNVSAEYIRSTEYGVRSTESCPPPPHYHLLSRTSSLPLGVALPVAGARPFRLCDRLTLFRAEVSPTRHPSFAAIAPGGFPEPIHHHPAGANPSRRLLARGQKSWKGGGGKLG